MLEIALILGAFLLLVAGFWLFLIALTPAPRARLREETLFSTCTTENQQLTSVQEPAQVDLTVVVPAYNEASRLPHMLREALLYLQSCTYTYEILVIDDGSTDNGQTTHAALALARDMKGQGGASVRVCRLRYNRGKGGAVTHGVLFARGGRILFADADAASKFSDLALLQQALDEIQTTSNQGLVAGSRAHMVNTAAVVQRSFVRNFLMRSFHLYLGVLGISSVKDTQCGFKLFTRETARIIFPKMHVEGWIFDIEMFTLAMLAGIPVKEVAITWNEVEGSKMQLVKDSVQMALDLLIIRINYATGRWTPPEIIT